MFKARVASLRPERGIWTVQHSACDLLDPSHRGTSGCFLQAGGLIAKNQNECLFTFDEVHSGEGSCARL